jgi:hypothetical protein
MRIEEPIREVVLDVDDFQLKRQIILDARRNNVDFDRGEVLPFRSVGDLRRYSFLTNVPLDRVQRHVRMDPTSFFERVDTAAVAIVGRHYEIVHRKKAHELWLEIPDPDGPEEQELHHHIMADRAEREAKTADSWAAFTKAVLEAK